MGHMSDEGTLAYLAGALHQAELFYERTGAYENIWRHEVAVSGSKTAVDSFDAVYRDPLNGRATPATPTPHTMQIVLKY